MNDSAPFTDTEIEALGQRIADTAAALDVGTHRPLDDLRRFDDERGWARDGALSSRALPVMAAPRPSWGGTPVDHDAPIDCLV